MYKGYVHLDGEEFKVRHQAIVTTKIWDKANKRFKNKIPKSIEFKKDNHVHLLKGIIKCDTFMTPYPSGKKDKNGNPYLYYTCGNVSDFGGHSKCNVRMVPAREFESTIKQALKNLGKNKALIDYSIKNTTRLNKKKIKPLDTEKENALQHNC